MNNILGIKVPWLLFVFCLCCSGEPRISSGPEMDKPAAELRVYGKAVRIIDGDTFDLLDSNQVVTRVRLYGIDCPESRQDFSTVAKNKLSELIGSRQVVAVKKDTDRYGRLVAVVYAGQLNVNEALLKAGLAWHFTRYDQNEKWAGLEKKARAKKIGLWSRKDAVAPWEWRNNR